MRGEIRTSVETQAGQGKALQKERGGGGVLSAGTKAWIALSEFLTPNKTQMSISIRSQYNAVIWLQCIIIAKEWYLGANSKAVKRAVGSEFADIPS